MAVVNGAGGFRESFIAEIDELRTKGLDLEKVVRQTMYESLGETPSEILFDMIGKSALLDPRLFVAGLSRMFGKGAEALCVSVVMNAREGLARDPTATGPSPLAQLTQDVSLAGVPRKKGKLSRFLHNHRFQNDTDEDD